MKISDDSQLIKRAAVLGWLHAAYIFGGDEFTIRAIAAAGGLKDELDKLISREKGLIISDRGDRSP